MTTRRSFITGLISFVAAPAIVRAGSLMPVKVMERYNFVEWPIYNEASTITLSEFSSMRNVLRLADVDRIWKALAEHRIADQSAFLDEMPFVSREA